MLIVAFVPAVVAGAAARRFREGRALREPQPSSRATFIIGGIVMLVVERFRPHAGRASRPIRRPFAARFGIGLCQTLALVPGRVALGRDDRRRAADAASIGRRRRSSHFFCAMPTMAAAFVHELREVRHHLAAERAGEIAIGFVMAFLAALIVVKPFLRFVSRSGFAPFAWYRIVVGRADPGRSRSGLAVMAVAAAHVSGGLLRHRPARDQRCRAGVDLRYH